MTIRPRQLPSGSRRYVGAEVGSGEAAGVDLGVVSWNRPYRCWAMIEQARCFQPGVGESAEGVFDNWAAIKCNTTLSIIPPMTRNGRIPERRG